ncbi:unnamed protein product [Linum tenue]|uniref:Protein kinase domain-containing protein n=1 Tax=Linum tenue TaxID=586396 RepID=A0AAV0RN46_9ROSI|nr:unnamed protein product [Linum tenue]
MSAALKRDYQICDCEEIGRGRFGTVFKCVSRSTGDSFAVKSIDKSLTAGASLDAQCLLTEPKALALVSPHPHLVQLRATYEDDSHLHIVTDLCPNSDLHALILANGGAFPERDARSIFAQLMTAVSHCHRKGVIHRDVKPDNVLMLAGFPPFYGETAVEIFDAVLRANLRFPTRVFGSVSPAAKDLLRRMLCKDVYRRFSAEQVLSKFFTHSTHCFLLCSSEFPPVSFNSKHKINGFPLENKPFHLCLRLEHPFNIFLPKSVAGHPWMTGGGGT